MEPIYDAYREKYKKPFGAVRRGEVCEFRLRFPEMTTIDEVTLICFRPGQKEHFRRMELIEKKTGRTYSAARTFPASWDFIIIIFPF